MKIIKVDFRKDENNKLILKDQKNIDKLLKYVFPIIEKNEGWDSSDLTKESFLNDPDKYQDTIDATVWKNVHILLENEKPVGLLEFGKTTITQDTKEHKILHSLLNGEGLKEFNVFINKELDVGKLSLIKSFLGNKPIYTGVGVVLKPNLQNKKSGYAEKLYEIISDGLVFGWTSNPIIVRKRRTLYQNTLFFPSFDEFPNSVEEWAVCLYVYAYVIPQKKDAYGNLLSGTMYSPYFAAERGNKYLEISKTMKKDNKITQNDEKRIKYVLSKKACAGAIVSWN